MILLRVAIQRVDDYYWFNVFYPMLVIILSSFSSISIGLDCLSDRLQVSISMILVVVAFQYSIRTFMPATNQVSIMDYYILSAVVITFMLITENGMLALIVNEADIEDWNDWEYRHYYEWVDRMFYLFLLFVWLFVHILLTIVDWFFHESWYKTFSREVGEEEWLPKGDQRSIFGRMNGRSFLTRKVKYEFYTDVEKIGNSKPTNSNRGAKLLFKNCKSK